MGCNVAKPKQTPSEELVVVPGTSQSHMVASINRPQKVFNKLGRFTELNHDLSQVPTNHIKHQPEGRQFGQSQKKSGYPVLDKECGRVRLIPHLSSTMQSTLMTRRHANYPKTNQATATLDSKFT